MSKKKKEIFPGILEVQEETNRGSATYIYRDVEKMKASGEYLVALSKLKKAKKLLEQAFDLVEEVEESVPYSNGKSTTMNVENLLLGEDAEELLASLLGIQWRR